MNVDISWMAVVLAAASTMIVGSIWYTPKVFGNTWMKLAKVKPTGKASDGTGAMILAFLGSLVTAYVLAHVTFLAHDYFGNSYMHDALSTAFWVWLGFTAARFITHDAFEMRPFKLTFLNVTHELVTFMVMGAIIGWIH